MAAIGVPVSVIIVVPVIAMFIIGVLSIAAIAAVIGNTPVSTIIAVARTPAVVVTLVVDVRPFAMAALGIAAIVTP